MKFTCKNPIFSNYENTTIDLDFKHPELGWLPFTASPHDTEPHGAIIFEQAIAGDFGPVAPYDGPSEADLLAQQARGHRDQLLAAVDVVVSNPLRWNSMSDVIQQAWSDYRQALLDVPQQNGFPFEIHWPEQP